MSKKPPKSVRLGFERDCMEIALDLLHVEIPLPTGIKETVKYKQICTSVQAIGLVEPIVVAHSRQSVGSFIVLDGRMRLEALRDRGAQKALCLISTDDEGYTYNKRVNRLSVVQEHRMIIRAAESGVSVQQLADVLDVTPGAIRQQFKLLDGICSEAVALLADKPATYAVFRTLKQMKPFRQIDVAQAMINLGNYSAKLSLAMLQATSPDQLTEEASAKAQRGGPTEALQRLERELAAVQADTRLLEEGYGPANLQLEIIKTYIGKTLLENAAVVRWLAKTHSEYLQQCSSSRKSSNCHRSSQFRTSRVEPGPTVHRAARSRTCSPRRQPEAGEADAQRTLPGLPATAVTAEEDRRCAQVTADLGLEVPNTGGRRNAPPFLKDGFRPSSALRTRLVPCQAERRRRTAR